MRLTVATSIASDGPVPPRFPAWASAVRAPLRPAAATAPPGTGSPSPQSAPVIAGPAPCRPRPALPGPARAGRGRSALVLAEDTHLMTTAESPSPIDIRSAAAARGAAWLSKNCKSQDQRLRAAMPWRRLIVDTRRVASARGGAGGPPLHAWHMAVALGQPAFEPFDSEAAPGRASSNIQDSGAQRPGRVGRPARHGCAPGRALPTRRAAGGLRSQHTGPRPPGRAGLCHLESRKPEHGAAPAARGPRAG